VPFSGPLQVWKVLYLARWPLSLFSFWRPMGVTEFFKSWSHTPNLQRQISTTWNAFADRLCHGTLPQTFLLPPSKVPDFQKVWARSILDIIRFFSPPYFSLPGRKLSKPNPRRLGFIFLFHPCVFLVTLRLQVSSRPPMSVLPYWVPFTPPFPEC